jgi:hypothetical protein
MKAEEHRQKAVGRVKKNKTLPTVWKKIKSQKGRGLN